MGTEVTKEREKCFVIMPISDQGDYPKGHFKKVYEQIFIPAIEDAGYEAFRVDEDNMSTPIIEKIFRAIQDCPMAICDLSNRNPNVLYELGIRQAYDKPVVLIQDDKTERIFDVSGINTIPYKSARLYEDVLEAREKITEAINATKEGKHNTIVKVVEAQSAVIPSPEMSKEDRIEVLLSGLIKDVNDIKQENRFSGYSENTNVPGYVEWKKMLDLPERRYPKSTTVVELKLKNGITDKQIDRVLSNLLQQFNVRAAYVKDKGKLRLTIHDENSETVTTIINQLRESVEEK